MTMDPDGGLRLPLRIDVSQVLSDLRTLDPEIERLEKRIARAYNMSDTVKQGRAPRADTLADVRTQLSGMSPSDLKSTLLAMKAPMSALNERIGQLERTARSGQTSVPATSRQAEQQAARARLAQVAATQQRTPNGQRGMNLLLDTQSADRLARSLARALPIASRGGAAAAAGHVGGVMSLVGGLARSGLLADLGLIAAPVTAALAVGDLALTANSMQSTFQRQQAALASALIGGPSFGSAGRVMQGLALSDLSREWSVQGSDVRPVAQNLATAGVPKGALLSQIKNTLMLAGPNQLNMSDVSGLAGQLATSGGMGPKSLNAAFQDVANISRDAGTSIQELLQSMKSLASGATAAARDVGSLAAIQRLVGPSSGIVAGSLMQPVMSSTGNTAMQQAGLLGMSPAAFLSAQTSRGGMATIYDRIAALVKRTDRGPAGLLATESILQSNGLLNTQGLNPGQVAALLTSMKNASPQQAAQLAQQLNRTADTQRVAMTKAWTDQTHEMERLTGWQERFGLALQNATTHLLNLATGNPVEQNLSRAKEHALQNVTANAYLQGNTSAYPTGAGIRIPAFSGSGTVRITNAQLAAAWSDSQRTGIPLTVLLAQLASKAGPNGQLSAAAGSPAAILSMAERDKAMTARYGGLIPGLNAAQTGSPQGSYGTRVVAESQEITVRVVVTDANGHALQPDQRHRVRVGAKQHGTPPPYDPHRRR